MSHCKLKRKFQTAWPPTPDFTSRAEQGPDQCDAHHYVTKEATREFLGARSEIHKDTIRVTTSPPAVESNWSYISVTTVKESHTWWVTLKQALPCIPSDVVDFFSDAGIMGVSEARNAAYKLLYRQLNDKWSRNLYCIDIKGLDNNASSPEISQAIVWIYFHCWKFLEQQEEKFSVVYL